MIKVVFKNLEKSEFAKQLTQDRFEPVFEKFPELKKLTVTLEMQNSPTQSGPDMFTVKAHFRTEKFKDLRVEKSAQSLYIALADVVEHTLELLNRSGDRKRVRSRNQKRKFDASIRTTSLNTDPEEVLIYAKVLKQA